MNLPQGDILTRAEKHFVNTPNAEPADKIWAKIAIDAERQACIASGEWERIWSCLYAGWTTVMATGSGLEKEQELKTGVQCCNDGPSVMEDIPVLAMAQSSLWK